MNESEIAHHEKLRESIAKFMEYRNLNAAIRDVGKKPPRDPSYSLWGGLKDYSLIETAYLWIDLAPDGEEFHPENPPKRVISIAGKIAHLLRVESDPSDWRDYRYTRETLIAFANERGEKPPFLFPEVRGDFDNWLRLTGNHPDEGLELSSGGYRAIAVFAYCLARQWKPEKRGAKNPYLKPDGELNIDYIVGTVLGEAEHLKKKEWNTHGVGKTSLQKLISNGLKYLRS